MTTQNNILVLNGTRKIIAYKGGPPGVGVPGPQGTTVLSAADEQRIVDLENAPSGDVPIELTNVLAVNNIHWDATLGNDANDGSVSTQKVQTWARVVALMVASAYNNIQIYGTVTISTTVSLRSSLNVVFAEAAGETAKLILDGGALLLWGVSALQILNVDIELGPSQNAGFFRFYSISSSYWQNSTFTDNGSGAGADLLLLSYARVHHAHFTNSPIAAIAGKVANGVAAGADPEAATAIRLTSNLSAF